ncbi:MAG: helix-turn-helix transcriptional regulator [Christensenellaceae bacterium]|nr:helix-turn-helix transcriptional regulator [Christensenellaceae bacterium]
MSFGQNLQCLRKMRNMTQEALAEKMDVSRQTVSKWELDAIYPEVSKIIDLCALFSCTMDQLVREDMNVLDDAYSDIREEWVEPMRYLAYTAISTDPEADAIAHVEVWAKKLGLVEPFIIGWDFPVPSQELINVHNMHGYTAALVLPESVSADGVDAKVLHQGRQKYMTITIREPFLSPFRLIPNAYKALMTYMHMNGIAHRQEKYCIGCFEKEYTRDGVTYMDIYIAAE